MIELFDRGGRAAAYCHDGKSISLWNGRPAAFIEGDDVFGYAGHYIGWLEDGWLRDKDGLCLLFEPDAIRGPAKPARGPRTAPGARGKALARGEMEAAPARPARSDAWSERVFVDLL